ncbi:hypothetical protein [Candidatus Magnetaquiglobus chichijimensis]|uniref:hypothetical protein n=1 Tax=Candidatus Magnetaquiglobus chichijimensis TaxID=3141448 RepID=UPI003B97840B
MGISFKDLDDESQELLQSASNEARFRTAASKFYYFAYHMCRTCLPDVKASGNYGMHKTFYKGLQNVDDLAIIGSRLEKLHALRVNADYHLKEIFSSSHLKRAKDLSDSISNDIKCFLSERGK